jgi:hypothetical protein
VQTNTPPGGVSYQWFRANGPTAPFQPVANGRSASYTLPSVAVADDGARFRVQVCSTRPFRCLLSNIARLNLGGPAAPVILVQPGDVSVPQWGTAVFFLGVQAANTLEVTWERSNDGGANWTPIGPGAPLPVGNGNELRFVAVAADNGAQFRAEACNVIGAQRTCVRSNSAQLEVRTIWTAPEVALDWRTDLDLPQAEPLNRGAVVNDNGTLRLLGITAPGVPEVLATGVFGRPRVVNLGGIYQWILFRDQTAGSNCGAFSGNRLNAIGLFVDVEGVIAPASPRFVVSDGPDCILDTVAAATAGGVALAVRRQSSGTPRGVRFTQQYNRATQTWSVAQVEDVPLSAAAACADASVFAERALAAPSRGLLPAPARAAVLAYESIDGGGQSWTCAATLSAAGVWSAVAPVRSNGTISPSTANVGVAMDPQGNAVLVGNAASASGTRALRIARLPVASSTWVEEASYGLTQEALLDLAADPDDGSVLMAWRDAPAAGAGFTTVFVAERAADGTWSDPLRVLEGDVDTRFPRVAMAPGGAALVTFQALDAGRFRVMGVRRGGGVFGAPAWIQAPGSPEGRFAVSPRYWFLGNSIDRLEGLPIYWRETDPADFNRTRIVRARVLPRP